MRLNKTLLSAMLDIVSKNDVRWACNYLLVDYDNKRLAATNNAVLAVLDGVVGLEGNGSQLISPASIKAAIQSKGKNDNIVIVRDKNDPKKVSIDGVSFGQTEPGIAFPNFDKILASRNTGKGQFPWLEAKNVAVVEKLMHCFDSERFIFHPGRFATGSLLFITYDDESVRIVLSPKKVRTAQGTYDKDDLKTCEGD